MTTPVVDIGEILNNLISGFITILQAFTDTLVAYAPVIAQVVVAGLVVYGIVRYGRRIIRMITGTFAGLMP